MPGLAGNNNGGSDKCSLRYTHIFEPGLSNILEIQYGGILWIFWLNYSYPLCACMPPRSNNSDVFPSENTPIQTF